MLVLRKFCIENSSPNQICKKKKNNNKRTSIKYASISGKNISFKEKAEELQQI